MKAPLTVPVIDLSACIRCGLCTELCPEVFGIIAGDMPVVNDLDTYPEEAVDHVIKHCPADCIRWASE